MTPKTTEEERDQFRIWLSSPVADIAPAAKDVALRFVSDYETLSGEVRHLIDVHPRDAWHEDVGPVLWWKFPICEPPYSGDPRDEDFPEHVTHWSRIPVVKEPR